MHSNHPLYLHDILLYLIFLSLRIGSYMGSSGVECYLGLLLVIAYPALLLVLSVVNRNKESNGSIVGFGLANHSFSTIQATCSLISSWFCGGYLFGSVESIIGSDKGLVWTHAAWAFAISIILNSMMFCDKLYEKDCITMFDPICRKFGSLISSILYIPCFSADILWISMTFSILRSFLSIVIDITTEAIMFFVALCVVLISIFSGMSSQKVVGCISFCIIILILCGLVCFLPLNPEIEDIRIHRSKWLGTIDNSLVGQWIDEVLVIVFGGTCWQVYYQQILSCKSSESAFSTSITSGFGTLFFGICAVFIGIYVSTINWSRIPEIVSIVGKESNLFSYFVKFVIEPKYQPVCVLLVIAVSIGTLQSSIFSCATIFSMNIYKEVIHKQAVDKEVLVVWKFALIIITLLSIAISYTIENYYSVFTFTSELMYIFIFPQLLLSVWGSRWVNTYGCLVGILAGFISRLSMGVDILGLRAWWELPSGFPFRLVSVTSTLVVEIVVSLVWQFLIEHRGYRRLDVLNVFSTRSVYSGAHVKGGRLRSHSLKIVEI